MILKFGFNESRPMTNSQNLIENSPLDRSVEAQRSRFLQLASMKSLNLLLSAATFQIGAK